LNLARVFRLASDIWGGGAKIPVAWSPGSRKQETGGVAFRSGTPAAAESPQSGFSGGVPWGQVGGLVAQQLAAPLRRGSRTSPLR